MRSTALASTSAAFVKSARLRKRIRKREGGTRESKSRRLQPRDWPPSAAPVCEWVGYAVVRAVDDERGLLYLSTPEPPERLLRVNALLRGALELPLAMLLPTSLTAASPYLTTEALKGAGAAAQRSRNNLVRQTG